MKFSIIIPAHNSENYIIQALDSVRKQTFTDYELIVVCDSCTDWTERLAYHYTDNVYKCEYGTDGLTRNVGLDHAKGDWILFMDDDDWWLHEFVLQMLSDRLDREGPDLDALVFGFIWKGMGYTPPIRADGHLWANVWSKCWMREFIGETRFRNIKMESDLWFCRDVIEGKNARLSFYDMPLYYYNFMRPGSQTEVAERNRREK